MTASYRRKMMSSTIDRRYSNQRAKR